MPATGSADIVIHADEVRTAPKHHIHSLRLQAKPKDTLPNISRGLTHLGHGLEADVYEYSPSYRTGPRALKVFKPADPETFSRQTSHDKDRLAVELSKPVVIAATNGRLAERVTREDLVVRLINKREDELRTLGYKGYHLHELQESYARVEDVNLQGFFHYLYLRALGMNRPDIAHEIVPILSGRDSAEKFAAAKRNFNGGLPRFIDHYVGWAARKWPELQIPEKLFADCHLFGMFPEQTPKSQHWDGDDFQVHSYSGQPRDSRLAGRMFLTMERLDGTLEDVIRSGIREVRPDVEDGMWLARNHSSLSTNGEIAQRIVQSIRDRIPIHEVRKVSTMLEILASMGITFGDLKRGNIGFNKQNQVRLLDLSSMVRTGSFQDLATPDYLPPQAAELAKMGMLTADPRNDQFAFQMILYWTQGAVGDMVRNAVTFDAIIEQERESREQASIRAAGRRHQSYSRT